MKKLLSTLSLFIGVYIIIASLFSFVYDTNGVSSSDSSNTELSINDLEVVKSMQSNDLVVDTSNVIIDNIYTQIILELFIADADKSGLDPNEIIEHIKTLDAIYVEDLSQYGLLGATVFEPEFLSPTGMRGIIIININLLQYPDLYMFTLYHELGHWFGLPHCGCDDKIMMDGYDADAVNEIFIDWDRKVKNLMKDIKKGYNKKEDHFSFPSLEEDKKDKKGRGKTNDFNTIHLCRN